MVVRFLVKLKKRDQCLATQEASIDELEAMLEQCLLIKQGGVPPNTSHSTTKSVRPTIPNQI